MGPIESAIVALAGLGIALVVASLWGNPILRRISFRNINRKKGSALLVIVGSMVGTALIAGSLVIGDTSRRLSSDMAYRHLGEIDEVVTLSTSEVGRLTYFDRTVAREAVSAERINEKTREAKGSDLVDGLMSVIVEEAPVYKVDRITLEPILTEPRAVVVAIDWPELARFGKRPPSLPQPSPGEVLASERLARELELVEGDTIQLLAGNTLHTFTVKAVLTEGGLAGYRDPLDPVLPAGTLLLALADGQALFAGGSDQVNTLFVSNAGGVADSFQHTQDVRLALASLDHVKDRLGGLRVRDVKSEVMGQDDWMSQIFLGVSSFAIVAGIMLVLNIYAMLAEERRKEMGVMRALGARRGHLARQYLYEGSVYSLVASVGGLVVGLGLAWLVIEGMNRFTWFSNTDSDLRMVFTVEVQTLIVAGAVGLLVALVTVLVTSLKISGINIVAAMKEQSEPKRLERRRWTMIWPALTAALGLLMTVGAVTGDDGTMYILGPTLAALGIVLMLQRYLPGPVLLSALALAIMAYSQIAFQIPAVKAADRDESTMFFLTSMVLVLAAIWLVVLNFPAVIWLMRQTLGRLRSTLPIVRIAIAYPADRPTRTGFTMGMFALVIFLTTVVSIFLHLIESQTEAMSRREVGGFDAVVAVNPNNPVPDLPQRLSRSETVDAAAILDTSALRSATIELPQFLQGDYPSEFGHSAPDPKAALMEQAIGLDTVFIRTTRSELDRRSPEYATDRQAWEALSRDPNLVIVDDTYSGSAWQIRHPVVKPGDVLKLRDPATGAVREKTVIGRLTTSELWMRPLSGVLMSSKALEEFVSKDGGPPCHVFRTLSGRCRRESCGQLDREGADRQRRPGEPRLGHAGAEPELARLHTDNSGLHGLRPAGGHRRPWSRIRQGGLPAQGAHRHPTRSRVPSLDGAGLLPGRGLFRGPPRYPARGRGGDGCGVPYVSQR